MIWFLRKIFKKEAKNKKILSAQEQEALKVLDKISQGYYKKDVDLILSVYHPEAIIETLGRGISKKDRLRSLLGEYLQWSKEIEFKDIEIKIEENSAIIKCNRILEEKISPQIYKLEKSNGQWLIIEHRLK